ncbi:syndecan isoform X2 [Bombyx mori]|uniref:Syndecan n=1 Tax=Bombyx mori TaxID=7091 RepID=A0A8R2GCW2_BOMMO|nr:syndecan isoform X2 [Bombyx mori]
MHLRIWIWLSCVVLAGYVRATEDAAVAESPSINLSLPLNDGVASDQSTFVDADEGSGLETDESSGSGWGAGPGPDDEDSSAVNKPSGGEVEPHGAGEERPSRPDQNGEINISEEDTNPAIDQEQAGTNVDPDSRPSEVFIMNAKPEDRAISFFAQPGILAAVIGGAVVGLLCAILVVMFIVYRMRKKDEGSYALDEPKRSPAAASYGKGHNNREFYA